MKKLIELVTDNMGNLLVASLIPIVALGFICVTIKEIFEIIYK